MAKQASSEKMDERTKDTKPCALPGCKNVLRRERTDANAAWGQRKFCSLACSQRSRAFTRWSKDHRTGRYRERPVRQSVQTPPSSPENGDE